MLISSVLQNLSKALMLSALPNYVNVKAV